MYLLLMFARITAVSPDSFAFEISPIINVDASVYQILSTFQNKRTNSSD